jgi:NAD(P)-dependent dehydrogenase (short-subunit alcohol dehydrogenase family)
MPEKKTAVITGASRGIGRGLVNAFLSEGYNVVGTSRHASSALTATSSLAVVDGDIGVKDTASRAVDAALDKFGRIDVLVNNAGVYLTSPFIDFTTEQFQTLITTNLQGFLYMTQLTVKQMLKQGFGNVVSISASLADQPISGVNGSVSMITKGGLNAITKSLAIEYAKNGLRFNAVAPGVVATELHGDSSVDALKSLEPMGKIVAVQDIVEAVLFLVKARLVTGEIIHVDGGAHAGRW